MAMLDGLRTRLGTADPPLAWTLRGYQRSWLRGDLLAGITVAALIVPLLDVALVSAAIVPQASASRRTHASRAATSPGPGDAAERRTGHHVAMSRRGTFA
jgi:hypothetical protein